MGLQIRNINLRNFRNYERFSIEGMGSLCIFIGPNAVGKTNLIEALQLTSAGFSFRSPKNEHLRAPGSAITDIESVIAGDGRELSCRMVVDDTGKQYFINRKKKPLKEIRGLLPAVTFIPDDLMLVKGSQRIKRSSLDTLGSQLSVNYDTVRKDYEKILRQKNNYLKEEVSPVYLESINEVMASIGSQLYSLRNSLLEELVPYVKQAYGNITGKKERVDISYIPVWEHESGNLYENFSVLEPINRAQARKNLEERFSEQAEAEIARGRTLSGPHLDRIEFYIDGRNAGVYASQGQQRSLVLAYKMAEVELIHQRLGQYPVLFLDDVMSELDQQRRDELSRLVTDEAQTFITSTNLGYFNEEILAQAQVIVLGDGTDGE